MRKVLSLWLLLGLGACAGEVDGGEDVSSEITAATAERKCCSCDVTVTDGSLVQLCAGESVDYLGTFGDKVHAECLKPGQPPVDPHAQSLDCQEPVSVKVISRSRSNASRE